MFKHRKITGPVVKSDYKIIQNSINRMQVAKASEAIGEFAATDMVEFSGIDKSGVNRLYVKYRDGQHFAMGMRKFLKKADIRYVVSERSGTSNTGVSASFWGDYDYTGHEDLVWFADPVNARGTTAVATLQLLKEKLGYDQAMVSHILANVTGIRTVQTKITDFRIDGFMNYAALSKILNKKTGYLDDGLQAIPDYGDKVFGTLGADYPKHQLQEDFKSLLGTQAGRVNVAKAIILFILQKRWSYQYKTDRQVVFPTRLWLSLSLLWYSKLRRIPHLLSDDLTERNISLILRDLEYSGFIKSEKLAIGKSLQNYYMITEEGMQYTAEVFNPVLSKENILPRVLKDFDFLVHLDHRKINAHILEAST